MQSVVNLHQDLKVILQAVQWGSIILEKFLGIICFFYQLCFKFTLSWVSHTCSGTEKGNTVIWYQDDFLLPYGRNRRGSHITCCSFMGCSGTPRVFFSREPAALLCRIRDSHGLRGTSGGLQSNLLLQAKSTLSSNEVALGITQTSPRTEIIEPHWVLIPVLITLTMKNIFLTCNWNLPFMTMASRFPIMPLREVVPGNHFIGKTSVMFHSLFKAEEARFSQPPFIVHVPQLLGHLRGPPLNSFKFINIRGVQNWMQNSLSGLTSAKYIEKKKKNRFSWSTGYGPVDRGHHVACLHQYQAAMLTDF